MSIETLKSKSIIMNKQSTKKPYLLAITATALMTTLSMTSVATQAAVWGNCLVIIVLSNQNFCPLTRRFK